jgi:CHAD domain-containing protein
MALVTLSSPLTSSVSPRSIGLGGWMDRALERADQVEQSWGADEVHDLRVALRRCRTMADALSEVDSRPGWRKLKKLSRPVFHALGGLRDAQVVKDWVKKLGPAGDPLRREMLRQLAGQERRQRAEAESALGRFDRKAWKKLARKLEPRARFFPPDSIVFQRLALAKLNAAVDLYGQARKRRSVLAWHRLRIGVKRFRYIVDNFLPQRSQLWAADLKRAQDLLGEVHDLDVLRGAIRRQTTKLDPTITARWLGRIESERKARLAEFISKVTGPESLWLVWRAGFPWGHTLVGARVPERRTA